MNRLFDRFCGTCGTLCDWVYDGTLNCHGVAVYNHWCPECIGRPFTYKESQTHNARMFGPLEMYQEILELRQTIAKMKEKS
jgi:hypothetical protein